MRLLHYIILRSTFCNTGEIGHGDATDDELLNEDHKTVKPESVGQRSKCILPLPPHPLVKKPSMTMDMLVSANVMSAVIDHGSTRL